jgi:hypothetical protein
VGLSLITLVSWWIGAKHGHEQFELNPAVTFAVLLIAAVKIRLIMREFMEVRHAPVLLCRLTDAWIVIVVASLLGIYALHIGIRAQGLVSN